MERREGRGGEEGEGGREGKGNCAVANFPLKTLVGVQRCSSFSSSSLSHETMKLADAITTSATFSVILTEYLQTICMCGDVPYVAVYVAVRRRTSRYVYYTAKFVICHSKWSKIYLAAVLRPEAEREMAF